MEITAGDRIDVPVALANDSDDSRAVTVDVQIKGLTLTEGKLDDRLTLAPQQTARGVLHLKPTIVEGAAECG